nr:Uncharacterised protein [Raoultella sp. NCTC 9187]
MTGIVALFDEERQRPLFSPMAAPQQRANRPLSRGGQRRRHDHKANPQRREQRFAERTEIDHRRVFYHSQHRRDRLTAVAKLAIVVIFHDPGIMLARVLQQRQTSPGAHHRSAWILVRRGSENEPRRFALIYLRTHAFTVDRHPLHPQPGLQKHAFGT